MRAVKLISPLKRAVAELPAAVHLVQVLGSQIDRSCRSVEPRTNARIIFVRDLATLGRFDPTF
jgi:hypothetical protein